MRIFLAILLIYSFAACKKSSSDPDAGDNDGIADSGDDDSSSAGPSNENVIYVHPDGDDSNPGTAEAPFLTIQAGIDAADAAYTTGEVHVAEGSYDIAAAIDLAAGISVYGGYKNDNWDIRSRNLFVTTINDTRTVGGTDNNPLAAITLLSTGEDLVFDGFTVNAASGTYSTAFNPSSAYAYTVQNNILNGGSGSTRSSGVFLESDVINTAVLADNTISGGTGGTAYGVYAGGSSTTIRDNTINTGNSANNYGIYMTNSTSCTVSGNTVTAGAGTNSYAIRGATAGCTFSGNTVHGGSGSTGSYGFYFSGSAPFPTLTGNSINGGSGGSSYGIYTFNGATITKNRVHGGTGTTAAHGIYNNSAEAVIFNNLVYGGDNSNSTYGIYLMNPTSPTVRNNTVNGGSAGSDGGDRSVAIYINGPDSAILQNNLLFTSAGDARYCIYDNMMTGSPPEPVLENNYLFACPTAAMYDVHASCTANNDGDATHQTCDVDDLNDLDDSTITWTASGNVGDAASNTSPFSDIDGADDDVSTLSDNNWAISAGAANAVKTGGLDGDDEGWGFTVDLPNATRTGNGSTGWSIGAYEQDS